MFKKLLFLTLIIGLAAACNKSSQTAQKEKSEEEAYQEYQSKKSDGKHFGEKVDAKGALTYDELVKKMAGSEKMEAKVTGTVQEVCQAKGCWMNIVSTSNKTPMFVHFKDYAFFMPKNLAGKKVVMQGTAYKDVTSVDELRHFAQDAGKSKAEIEAINKPKEELKFMASGVLVLD